MMIILICKLILISIRKQLDSQLMITFQLDEKLEYENSSKRKMKLFFFQFLMQRNKIKKNHFLFETQLTPFVVLSQPALQPFLALVTIGKMKR